MTEDTQDSGVHAPFDFDSHFVLVEYTTARDGLFAGKFKATRYSSGRFNPALRDPSKVRDLMTYDPETAIGIAARLAARTFKTDPLKRLLGDTTFEILIRVGVNKATNHIATSVKSVAVVTDLDRTELAQVDPASRMLRSAGRFLPPAFANVKNIPDTVQKSEVVDE
jgi:hypothetical protein